MRSIVAALLAAFLVLVVVPPAAGNLKDLEKTSEGYAELVEKVRPAVVQIFVSGYAPGVANTAEGASTLLSKRQSSGSGVIVDKEGYIVTNSHVVLGGREILVRLANPIFEGSTSVLGSRGIVVEAEVLGVDTETDLAVLKIDEPGLTELPFGDSDELRQGNIVLAFGSPFMLENTVSMGVVSSVARQLRPEDPMVYIQTDATINPGNSGGALVNTKGELVGINTLIFSLSGGSQGLGFSAPSNIVRAIYKQLRQTGTVQRGIIGVNAQTITPLLARGLGLPQEWGVIVGDVYPGSPADLAGLKRGDIILSLDGKTMENGRQLDVNVYRRTIGQAVKLEVLRAGERRVFNVPVVDRPNDPDQFADQATPEKHLVPSLGILALTLTPELRSRLPGVREPSGVVVALVGADHPLSEVYLAPGDVIHAVNGKMVETIDDLRREMDQIAPKSAVALQIERGGRHQYLGIFLD